MENVTANVTKLTGGDQPVMIGPGDRPVDTLNTEYNLRVRPMIDLIDKLRRIGLDKEVGLPSIVVVGDQSAGKSSVLEAISGVQLPRGSGIVTRCPLELRLKRNARTDQWRARIRYSLDVESIDDVINDPNDVGENVVKAQDALVGADKGISTELITLEIEAPNVPDLTLIDLPGIVRVTMKGQPDNLAQTVKNMIKGFIQRKETIILAVVPANVDIETSEALQMANEVDPGHDRTLGVVTKADLVDKGAEDGLISVLLNEKYPLRKGYIAVKCRGQQAIRDHVSLQQALQDEKTFFTDSEHFRVLGEQMYGVPSLSCRLAEELAQHVQLGLPTLKDEVFKKRGQTSVKLLELGEGIPKDKIEKTRFLTRMLQSYSEDLGEIAKGRESCLPHQTRLLNEARKSFETFAKTIRENVEAKERSTAYRNQVRSVMQNDRGCELPRFIQFGTFKNLAAQLVKEFEPPSRRCLDDVQSVVKQRLGKLAKKKFERFPRLEAKVKGLVATLMAEAVNKTEESLKETFEMEQIIFSQDDCFNRIIDDIIKKQLENTSSIRPSPKHGVGYLDVGVSPDKELETMCTVIQAYTQIALTRIADCVPLIIMLRIILRVTKDVHTRVMYLTEDDAGGLDALREERDVTAKRDQLIRSLNRLEEASKELNKFDI